MNVKKLVRQSLPHRALIYLKRVKYWRSFPAHHRELVNSLSPSDVVVDCGANIGVASALFAHSGARVVAFEPDPLAFERLRRTAKMYPNVEPVNAAVGVKDGRERLLFSRRRGVDALAATYGSSMIASNKSVSTDGVDVKVVDLSEQLRQIGRVKLLKLDIEGSEVFVIPHLLRTGGIDLVDTLVVELHERISPEIERATGEMKKAVEAARPHTKVFYDWP